MKLTVQLVDASGNLFAGEAFLKPVAGNGKVQANMGPQNSQRDSAKLKCPSAIDLLWRNGEFKKWLSFHQVKTALAEEGYNFAQNTLMMALQNSPFLTRRGGRGDYNWTQKYPFKP